MPIIRPPTNPYSTGPAPNFQAAYDQSQQQIQNGTAGGSGPGPAWSGYTGTLGAGGPPPAWMVGQGGLTWDQGVAQMRGQQASPVGYTAGPAGSSGGLTGSPNPYPVGYIGPGGQQMNPAQTGGSGGGWSSVTGQSMDGGGASPTGGWGFGYGTAPGQSNRGYYEQQTPLGSFAAADRTAMPQQQIAQAFGAGNPYIGRTSQGIGGQQSVMPYAQQMANAGQQANPYLGQTSAQAQSVGSNPYMGRNPYLDQQVQAGLDQSARSFNSTVLPQYDRMAQASGSFGNTGVEAARQRAVEGFGRSQANAANAAYMQDYQNTQQLAESGLNRQQGMNQFNAGLGAADLNRNLAGAFTGQQLGMQGLSSLLGAGQFDATLGNNVNQFNAGLGAADLGRNSQLAQQLGMFNAGQGSAASQFNAAQGNQMGMQGAQLGQQLNMFNTGNANSMLENGRNRTQQNDQYYANLDFNIDNSNWNRMRTGQQDQINLVGQLLGWNQGGIGNANQIQGMPLQYLQQLAGIGQGLGGLGGTASQQLNGNPLLGAIGGWQLAQQLFGG